MEEFCYLESVLTHTDGADRDVNRRIRLARTSFITLNKVLSTKNIKTRTKLKLFRSNSQTVLLYGSETWKVNSVPIKSYKHLSTNVKELSVEYSG